jgi:hypothetical protein
LDKGIAVLWHQARELVLNTQKARVIRVLKQTRPLEAEIAKLADVITTLRRLEGVCEHSDDVVALVKLRKTFGLDSNLEDLLTPVEECMGTRPVINDDGLDGLVADDAEFDAFDVDRALRPSCR